MNKWLIGLLALMTSSIHAQASYNVEIQAGFVAFDKAALDQLSNANPNQIPAQTPYPALWIANTELLTPFRRHKAEPFRDIINH